ncbi:SSI family serine proteinase inhibitor [Rhizohabitans arisaemae]|uniref:SSI family serine proteinase inhibitor n=1 Tax=Rhizohabitans arisaemae TaxID=2720610 RepID=UPI0024B070DD|nr:SSI family serine proteinase inhibitor [Rhizohabitans arisaemae]
MVGVGAPPVIAASDSASSGTLLTIKFRDPGHKTVVRTLRCDPAGGNHPRAAKACAALHRFKNWHEPVAKNRACTLIYGGPQTATVEGRWKGRWVEGSFNRLGGCEIERWAKVGPVLNVR